MTKQSQIVIVTATFAVLALITTTHLLGDIGKNKLKSIQLPKNGGKLAGDLDEVIDFSSAKLASQTVLTYQPLQGDPLFALQLKLDGPKMPRRPRDLVLLLSTSAGQAGANWNAARQLVEAFVKQAGPQDRLAIWTLGTPNPKFTRCLTGALLHPKAKQQVFTKALEDMKKQYPAGDTDLGYGLTQVMNSFDRQDRQRAILYIGNGMSLHTRLDNGSRHKLAKELVRRRIAFFPIPLGKQFDPANLHGLATGTGGTVIRAKIFSEKVSNVVQRADAVLSAPIFYPTGSQFAAPVLQAMPKQLPPLRSDVPTLVIGSYKKGGQKLHLNLRGEVDGQAQFLNKQLAYDLPKHEDDHYFLVSIFTQWKNAPQQQAMIQADRALVFAYQKNRLGHQELLEAAAMARSLDKLEAAEKLYKRAHALVPHDLEAKMGLEVVAKLRSGELTKQQLRKQLEKAAHRQGAAH